MKLTLWQRLTRPFRAKRPVRVEWVAAEVISRGYNLTDIRMNGDWMVAYEEEEVAIVEAIVRLRGQGYSLIDRGDV